MPLGTPAPLPQSFDSDMFAILMQLAPILLLAVLWGVKAIVFGFIAYHLAKSRRINRTCAVFAGIFGGITALLLIGMLERTDAGFNMPPARGAEVPQNCGIQQ